MREVSSFIHTSLSSLPYTTPDDAKKVADTYEGLAEVFQRIANDMRSESASGEDAKSEGEVATLLDFAEKGKKAVIKVRESKQ